MGPLIKTVDDPLHPLHPLRALLRGSRRRRRDRRALSRRGHADHHLPRAGGQARAVGQRDRLVPGRRADQPALCVRSAAVGARRRRCRSTCRTRCGSNIRIDSRGREVLRVLPRINDDVNEEWAQRQGALPGRRPDPPPARQAVWIRRERQARARRAGTRRSRRSPRSSRARASRRSPATCSIARRCSRPRRWSARWARRCSRAARPAWTIDASTSPRSISTRPSPGSRKPTRS